VGALPPLDGEYEALTARFREQRLAAVPVSQA
jgi:hypothetical protein